MNRRRALIGISTVAITTALLNPRELIASQLSSGFPMTMNEWRKYRGDTFQVNGNGLLRLELVESTSNETMPNQFCLMFSIQNKAAQLPQETYEVEHATLGKGSLFLVPEGVPKHSKIPALPVKKMFAYFTPRA